LILRVPAGSFYPVPKVDSAVVRIDCSPAPAVPIDLLPTFFRVLKAGFGQKRKKLRNTLASGLQLSSAASQDLLRRADIDPARRAETLTVAEWAQIAEAALALRR
jgi:16S rRNA (adenine1518-N6/adenine1519-N6)-dimethyltransferase